FQINQEGAILNSSNITHSYFPPISNIWTIIHKKDRNKAIVMLSLSTNFDPVTKNLILQTRNGFFGNFKCTIQWKEGIGHLVCTEVKSSKVLTPLSVQSSLVTTKKRLEESEKTINKVVKILRMRKH
ncbi:hypothetical protein, partial [Priestia megaterium]|uniref:hypothetical protein n=1 Tax=Priestia megaterium TaxID=1404 RepID=UPI003000C2F0